MTKLTVENNIPQTVPSGTGVCLNVQNPQRNIELSRHDSDRAIVVDNCGSGHAEVLDTITKVPEVASWTCDGSIGIGACRTIKTVRVRSTIETGYGNA